MLLLVSTPLIILIVWKHVVIGHISACTKMKSTHSVGGNITLQLLHMIRICGIHSAISGPKARSLQNCSANSTKFAVCLSLWKLLSNPLYNNFFPRFGLIPIRNMHEEKWAHSTVSKAFSYCKIAMKIDKMSLCAFSPHHCVTDLYSDRSQHISMLYIKHHI